MEGLLNTESPALEHCGLYQTEQATNIMMKPPDSSGSRHCRFCVTDGKEAENSLPGRAEMGSQLLATTWPPCLSVLGPPETDRGGETHRHLQVEDSRRGRC
jgi:hypothetical protein